MGGRSAEEGKEGGRELVEGEERRDSEGESERKEGGEVRDSLVYQGRISVCGAHFVTKSAW